MRILIQHVKEAEVTVDSKSIGKIKKGLLVFLGIHKDDTQNDLLYLKEKLLNLRIFNGMDKSIQEVNGELLIVSQFTLYGNCAKGRRPSFDFSAKSDVAKPLYETFVAEMKKSLPIVQTGEFGAQMEVHLINDGPLTFLIDSRT